MWSEEDGQSCHPCAHGVDPGHSCMPPGPDKDGTVHACEPWTKTLWRPFQHFKVHAGQKDVGTAPGAWLQLRDGLDYSDATRFPAADFGGGSVHGKNGQKNTGRLRAIIEHFAPMGARMDDVAAASASRHQSRDRHGINNIGWRIWPHNYGVWMTQVDPLGTSLGRWCVGDSATNLLGQNTRQTVPGKDISFVLSPGLFGGSSGLFGGSSRGTLYVRVAFFDEGHGSWELHYASASGAMRLATHVQKTDTREFVEVRLQISDLDLDLGRSRLNDGAGSAHGHSRRVLSEQSDRCSGDGLSARTTDINEQCCGSDDAACNSGVPTSCDIGCANVFMPFVRDCPEAVQSFSSVVRNHPSLRLPRKRNSGSVSASVLSL